MGLGEGLGLGGLLVEDRHGRGHRLVQRSRLAGTGAACGRRPFPRRHPLVVDQVVPAAGNSDQVFEDGLPAVFAQDSTWWISMWAQLAPLSGHDSYNARSAARWVAVAVRDERDTADVRIGGAVDAADRCVTTQAADRSPVIAASRSSSPRSCPAWGPLVEGVPVNQDTHTHMGRVVLTRGFGLRSTNNQRGQRFRAQLITGCSRDRSQDPGTNAAPRLGERSTPPLPPTH